MIEFCPKGCWWKCCVTSRPAYTFLPHLWPSMFFSPPLSCEGKHDDVGMASRKGSGFWITLWRTVAPISDFRRATNDLYCVLSQWGFWNLFIRAARSSHANIQPRVRGEENWAWNILFAQSLTTNNQIYRSSNCVCIFRSKVARLSVRVCVCVLILLQLLWCVFNFSILVIYCSALREYNLLLFLLFINYAVGVSTEKSFP